MDRQLPKKYIRIPFLNFDDISKTVTSGGGSKMTFFLKKLTFFVWGQIVIMKMLCDNEDVKQLQKQ